MKNAVIPVLLGADMNCYSLARAFHEAYGVKSHVFGKVELGAIKYSKIIRFTNIPPLNETEKVIDTLVDFAKNAPQKPYIFGCTDEYVVFISKYKSVLEEYYVCVCPDKETVCEFSEKDNFYKKCAELSIKYPEYICLNKTEDAEKLKSPPFEYPIIIKPSCSYKYWYHPFDGMQKVYVAKDFEQAKETVNKIYLSGYNGKIIAQKKINNATQYVATCYSENGKNTFCIGRVLLGEVTPKGVGNHVAIITENNDDIKENVNRFLSGIQYSGFSNFDILCDEKSGKLYLLEMNSRLGRSNYYMTAAGMNPARIALEGKFDLPQTSIFWHSVPKSIIVKNASPADRSLIKELSKAGRDYSTFFYGHDLKSPMRLAYVAAHQLGFFAKYKKYGSLGI